MAEVYSPMRPQTPQKSHSFTRLDTPRSSPRSRSRASTLQNVTIAEPMGIGLTASPLEENKRLQHDDIFEKDNLVKGDKGKVQDVSELDSPQEVPEGFDELPVELISLIDRFIDSLGAKVHNTPPSIEKLSEFFQDFYGKADSHISTHIGALSTRQSRAASPSQSISSKTSTKNKDGKELRSSSSKDTIGSMTSLGQEQQMLTPQEISDRRKARRLLQRKGVALEEAVERRVCERVYKRIWRHRSTLDEVRDDKLRSRTAALALVGIGLGDLGISFDTSGSDAKGTEVEEWISKARDGLLRMNDTKYPLGKLQQLAAAHKSIVDLLTALHQSSSSADEILPTLIYTLITTPPEGINVISNLHFIQRFRASNKIDGEAAYCLVNLEAAITFLETVDLASLRSDESLEGPPKSASRPSTPHDDTQPGWLQSKPPLAAKSSPTTSLSSLTSPLTVSEDPLQSPSPPRLSGPTSLTHQRKLSNLFQPPASALGAAGDAVDQGFKTIGNTLDNSFKLLFGRLKEQKVAGEGADADGTIAVPRTLEDARKLVEPKLEDENENPLVATPLELASDEQLPGTNPRADDSLLSAIAGRKPSRDRSVDSTQSSGSNKRVSFVAADKNSPTPQSGNGAVESMLSLGNSLNPLKGFGGLSMRGFGVRNSSSGGGSSSGVPTAQIPSPQKAKELENVAVDTMQAPGTATKINPPIQRFLDSNGVEDLKVGEIAQLLNDYKRLAGALKDMKAF